VLQYCKVGKIREERCLESTLALTGSQPEAVLYEAFHVIKDIVDFYETRRLLLTSVQPTTTQFSRTSSITKKTDVLPQRDRKPDSSGIYICPVLVEIGIFVRETTFHIVCRLISLF
jgi:hypothetical protein